MTIAFSNVDFNKWEHFTSFITPNDILIQDNVILYTSSGGLVEYNIYENTFNHIDKIFCPMLAVGAAFDFHAGLVKQAPKWMQDFGLEWLYRLIQEPRRLWKRYLFTNTHFIVKFLIYKLTRKYKK